MLTEAKHRTVGVQSVTGQLIRAAMTSYYLKQPKEAYHAKVRFSAIV
jgi:hypothetical protein